MAARRGATPKDWDQASKHVANAYFPHELKVPPGRREPRLTLQTLDLGPVLVGYVGWGADVQVECDYPGAYEINMPLTGHLVSRGRYGQVTSVPGQATVFRADTPSLISHWDATCTVLGVKFDAAWLDREAERILGPEFVRASAVLPEQLKLESGSLRDWRNLLAGLTAHLREPSLFIDQPAVREQLAGAVSTGFLLASCPDLGHGTTPRPRAISRVTNAIRDDPARPWTAADMAGIAGTSVRRLQEGFRDWMGCSPSEHLLSVRLHHAREELLDRSGCSVSDIAARWGFSSASRFAAAYRRRYGQAPSDTRRQ